LVAVHHNFRIINYVPFPVIHGLNPLLTLFMAVLFSGQKIGKQLANTNANPIFLDINYEKR